MTGPAVQGAVPVGPAVSASGPPVMVPAASSTVGGDAVVVSGRPQITDTSAAPLGLPVALVRGSDGLLRPDRAAIADRPTRDEVGATVAAHVNDEDPHPAYDDIADLRLWFDNALL